VIKEVIPNYTSDKHPYFQKALQGDEKYKGYYIWAEGKNKDNKTPPNNWISISGGSAWTYVDSLKEWYLHQYGPGLPDFNYSNPEIVEKVNVSFRKKFNCSKMLLSLSLSFSLFIYMYICIYIYIYISMNIYYISRRELS